MTLVDISPDVLEYKPPFTAQSTEFVTIANNSQEQIAFKVKTTAPKFYCVRPNAALLGPGESVQVQVILLGLSKEPEADFKCRDKFLVITLPAPYDLGSEPVANAWPRLETEFKQQAVSKKIKVKYALDSEPHKSEQGQPAQNLQQQQKLHQQQEQQQQQQQQPQQQHQQHQPVPEQAQEHYESKSQPQQVHSETERVFPDQNTSSPANAAPLVTAQSDAAKPVAEPETQARNDALPQKVAASSQKESVTAQEGSLNSSALIMIAIIALVLGWLYY